MRSAWAVALLPCLSGCSEWFFSGESWIDRTRPVALVETTGGIEFGATTEFGVLTLGRSASDGPCRVHYFLGPTPIVETGKLTAVSDTFTRAEIDLKTQLAPALDRSVVPDDSLLAMWTPDGKTVRTVSVRLAKVEGVHGDVLLDPGEPLPTGATVMCRIYDGTWQFTGLIAGTATVQGGPASGTYYVFAGVDRVRELLAVPTRHPVELEPKYRLDDISVLKQAQPDAVNAPAKAPDAKTPAAKPDERPKK
jgi:hypothetical protein